VCLARDEFVIAHDDVAVAVAVDVPRPRDRPAEPPIGHIAIDPPGGALRQKIDGVAAEIDERPAAVVVVGGADDDIAVAITVYVPRRSHRPTEQGIVAVALGPPVVASHLADGKAPAAKDIDTPLPSRAVFAVVERGTDDDIGEAVAVHVARRRHGIAQTRAAGFAYHHPGGVAPYSVRAAEVHECPALANSAVVMFVVVRGTDDDIAETVAVHVTCRGHRPAEPGTVVVSFHQPRRPGGVYPV